ncbi:hypothetical protein CYMTET_17132, partial [Cymbomonas tetramitiformis]
WLHCVEPIVTEPGPVPQRLLDLVMEMAYSGQNLVGTKTWWFKSYQNAFVGTELVRWMVQAGYADSRDAAVALGQKLLSLGLIRHVEEEHQFYDKHYFYEFQMWAIGKAISEASNNQASGSGLPNENKDTALARFSAHGSPPSSRSSSADY